MEEFHHHWPDFMNKDTGSKPAMATLLTLRKWSRRLMITRPASQRVDAHPWRRGSSIVSIEIRHVSVHISYIHKIWRTTWTYHSIRSTTQRPHTQKESSVLFQGRSLSNSTASFILCRVTFPLLVQNVHCAVPASHYRLQAQADTGRIPKAKQSELGRPS